MTPVRLHFKGTLCDDHLHMTPAEYREHKQKEYREKQRMALRKMANNPILSDESRNVLNQAVYNIDLIEFWRDLYIREREKNKLYDMNEVR